ncbi:tetratricopeptide repeat protein [Zooshikella sp. RANM57]|uniref:tetratricopeptide repeat protein n=1 Tax=Zooshikella sp. RANM57 TaxID=3425863 RepID=UPI003D6FD0F0
MKNSWKNKILKNAILAYENNEVEKAIHFLKILANESVSTACRLLGLIYSVQSDTIYDEKYWNTRFITSLKKEAQGGDIDALFKLANLYQHGDLVTQNEKKAQCFFLKAATNGHTIAQFHLAMLYKHGFCSLPINDNAYQYWLKIAADNAHPEAMYYHGLELIRQKRYSEAEVFIYHANQKGFWLAEDYINKFLTPSQIIPH